ncbi:hypothetical protein G6F57_006477 [Rhizopus arrhizus]|uniref:Uncharacterized protein n=1 Tax=Rhizopus oryzae TaxID=64495 RepID=A0A9P6X114_RHIOR|nr:hypothetical protein G6F23_008708 [Rhizopus arrhizus]KAG1422166.1 hypothetical protein G6F58_003424 [Rhizopus delemar]KAG0787450.1 hypothetical protein G6F22_007318 [Rhizopus arrhizus]KAG0788657.1 hypothetical protein G6F21_007062 [Rhizopus arrhizus]KAG0810582.1 hypothetical protein G6F20_007844 [Rhizopus arrhizus]
MTNQSHSNSLSPHSKQPTSAFQWPIPPSSQPGGSSEISIKEILDRYSDDPELLKCILAAKSEEDKKKAARDTLKAYEARIQLRQMDLELVREQSKPRTAAPPYVYGLAPVQQQVLARFNYPQQPPQSQQRQQQQQQQQQQQLSEQTQHRPPPSPAIPYPHSAHPLCPPSSSADYRLKTSSIEERSSLKRNRSSISNDTEQDKLSHDKVMEALKAKIQRSSNPQSPLSAPKDTKKKKQMPRPAMKVDIVNQSPSSSSPRSAKPILPPIDTSLGRINQSLDESNSTGNDSTDSSKRPSPVQPRRSRSLTPSM